MKPCLVGIGGCGGKVLKHFLQNQDLAVSKITLGRHLCFGGVRGVWLEAATMDAQGERFFGRLEEGHYPGYLIPHEVIREESKLFDYVKEKYGYDLRAAGFDRRAEYLKAVFEIFEGDGLLKKIARNEHNGEENPVLRYIWKRGIRPHTILSLEAAGPEGQQSSQRFDSVNETKTKPLNLCDSILFIASLGGGTGTGFINPLTQYVRAEQPAFPVLMLCALTELGVDSRGASEEQRSFAAAIALHDLLTTRRGQGVDGLILFDNQILLEKSRGIYEAMNRIIFETMIPFLETRNYPDARDQSDPLAMRRKFLEGLELPPILIPCYSSIERSVDPERHLVESALNRGKLFPCNPDKSERAYVFARGFVDSDKVLAAVTEKTGVQEKDIMIYRKLGDNKKDELLMLLRNPFGEDGSRDEIDTFEYRICRLIDMAIKYMENHEGEIVTKGMPEDTRTALGIYLKTFEKELREVESRLKMGEKPPFINELRIFEKGLPSATPDLAVVPEEDKMRNIVREVVEEELGKRGIPLTASIK